MTTVAVREKQSRPAELAEPRRCAPVLLWAVAGVVFVALQLYIYAAWLTSGDLRRTPSGPDEAPRWMEMVIHAFFVAGLVAMVLFVFFVVIRPWRREGRLPLDGYFVLAFLSIYWQDMLMNYTQNWVTQNAILPLQWGSWNGHVPGWLAPNGSRIVESVGVVAPEYVYVLLGATMLGCLVMRKAKQRWPQLGTLGLLLVGYGFFAIFDLIGESTLMRLGFFAYPGAIRSFSLFPGKYYQFPLYEPLMFGITLALLAGLRYFRNDKGETYAERGLYTLRVSSRRKSVIRGLALCGALNVIYLFSYMVPIQWFALHADPWPADILNRSYLTNHLCGPGTAYKCSGPGTPIPRVDSDHVDPNGDLIISGRES